ncbi:penicillin-binding protein [Bacteroides xylanisolvens]|uniref:Penicillin-binding protein n=2 Tax=Bacteroides TaxID=816 RepID=A0A415FCV5_9BACE|nr:penicillin-binding protein [Bacteroides sp. NSJ-39]RHE00170.1 penicillin-binding protein [Bacteroides ovatus]RHF29153.1 penicillin-binding protein [Bacteroides xylanisolvens]RHK16926.1 penicillin-binding protein [Bacteroides xylanisolvens]
MEVQTGQIKALVGLTRKDSANYQSCENFSVWQSTGLMHPISLLAALETGKVKLSDKVDTGNGIYQIHGRELKDHNWHRGGYGELTIQEGLAASSNIATYKTMEKAFGDNPQTFFDLLANMSYGKPDSINGIANLNPAYFVTPKDNNWAKSDFAWSSIGYNQQISPIQILTFYNAIANDGKMIQPQLYKDSVVVINPQIASRVSIDSLKKALVFNITDGLGQPAKSDKVLVAGMQGTSSLSTNEDSTKDMYAVEFCGYFPTDNPKYSIIVSINKTGLPASGGLMAGDAFREFVDKIMEK